MSRNSVPVTLPLFVGVLFAALYIPNCTRKDQTRSAGLVPKTPAERTYTLRGRITGFPNPPKESLRIHHEALPDFTDAEGKVIGMDEMEMHFPFVAPDVSFDGLKLNEPIEATMEMRYKSEPRFLITRITKLPEDTKLNLGKIEVDEAAAPAAPHDR
jgi:hypothetical protein